MLLLPCHRFHERERVWSCKHTLRCFTIQEWQRPTSHNCLRPIALCLIIRSRNPSPLILQVSSDHKHVLQLLNDTVQLHSSLRHVPQSCWVMTFGNVIPNCRKISQTRSGLSILHMCSTRRTVHQHWPCKPPLTEQRRGLQLTASKVCFAEQTVCLIWSPTQVLPSDYGHQGEVLVSFCFHLLTVFQSTSQNTLTKW